MAAPGMQGIGSGAAPPAAFPMPGGMGMAGMPGVDFRLPALNMPGHCLALQRAKRVAIAICRLAAGARVRHATARRIHRRHELG